MSTATCCWHMRSHDVMMPWLQDLYLLPAIDIPALRQHIMQQRDSVWEDLDICPRTCPSKRSRCCTYASWSARPPHRHARSLLDIPVSAASMKRLLRLRMGCHRLPRDEGSWARPEVPRLDRVCQLCGAGALGDERHLVFECPDLLCFREQWSHLFEGPQTMQAVMWQEDLIGIVRFINACLHKMNSMGQTSDQPGVAGRDVI